MPVKSVQNQINSKKMLLRIFNTAGSDGIRRCLVLKLHIYSFTIVTPALSLSLSLSDNEGGEVSPPIGTGVDSNSWHFRYGPGPGGPPPHLKPGEVPPEAFIIPGSPAIISIRQGQDGDDKSDFISFGKKDEKKKKKKKKEKKDKREKGKDDDD